MSTPPTIVVPKRRMHHKRRASPNATPPPPQVLILEVLGGNASVADWVFGADVVDVGDVSPLIVNGGSPTKVVEIDGNVVRLSYDVATDVGLPWNYDGTVAVIFDNGGVLQPGSGQTQEG